MMKIVWDFGNFRMKSDLWTFLRQASRFPYRTINCLQIDLLIQRKFISDNNIVTTGKLIIGKSGTGWPIMKLGYRVPSMCRYNRASYLTNLSLVDKLDKSIWASSWDNGTYHQATSKGSGEPAQFRQSLRCSHTWSMEVDKGSDQKSDI